MNIALTALGALGLAAVVTGIILRVKSDPKKESKRRKIGLLMIISGAALVLASGITLVITLVMKDRQRTKMIKMAMRAKAGIPRTRSQEELPDFGMSKAEELLRRSRER